MFACEEYLASRDWLASDDCLASVDLLAPGDLLASVDCLGSDDWLESAEHRKRFLVLKREGRGEGDHASEKSPCPQSLRARVCVRVCECERARER